MERLKQSDIAIVFSHLDPVRNRLSRILDEGKNDGTIEPDRALVMLRLIDKLIDVSKPRRVKFK